MEMSGANKLSEISQLSDDEVDDIPKMYADLVENGGQRSVKERLNGNGTSGPTWLQQQHQITSKRTRIEVEFGRHWSCGMRVFPNVVIYTVLIEGDCLRGEVDEAKKMTSRKQLNGLKDNVATNTSLLKGMCIKGKSDETIQQLREIFFPRPISRHPYHLRNCLGRFLLAAVSGRILAQSYHSVLQVGYEMIEQAVNTTDGNSSEYQPEIAWKRWELSVMLEHVQAHVAPTNVDLGAGVQWLPKILIGSPKVMRTGALLERVFMPCDMYFQFTRHKGGTPELKVILFVSLQNPKILVR
ncbi:unnamed protein product [Sphenostylis stenocarpa]|uniref:Uncharacterized protein n=1 Tax=Sphenostylis stenocarpa TaxID=92480 RepID=A0AA86VAQ0_9FABA|nr:unnamed protein product [Sphenostylis stenocarpa]